MQYRFRLLLFWLVLFLALGGAATLTPSKVLAQATDKASADKPQPDAAQPAKPQAQPDKPQNQPDKTQAAAADQEQPKDWQVLLSIHQESLVQQASRFKSMEELLPKNVRQFRSNLANLEGKLDELGLIISLSGGNPWELRAVLNDMTRLRRSTETLMAPFRDTREELEKISVRLDSLKEEFAKRQEEDPEPPIADAINYYVRYVTGVKSGLSRVRSTLDKELGPAKDFLEGIAKNEEALRQQIPKAWKSYFFIPASDLLSWKAWSESLTRLRLWSRSNGSMLRSLIWGADSTLAMAVATKAAVGLVLLALADLVAAARLRRRFPSLDKTTVLRHLRRVWRLAGLGLILHWVALGAPLLLYEILNGATEILLAAALAAFSWLLAIASGLMEDPKAESPLRRLWIMFSLGLLFQIADIPDPLLTASWLVLMLVFFQITRKAAARDAGLLRLLSRVTPGIVVLIILVSTLGWQHLSVLILSGWFLFMAAVEIGASLSRLVSRWQIAAAGEGESVFTRGAISGLGFPLIFLSLFFLVLYWFSTELGGQELFFDTIAATVAIGDINVTLGRLAVILTGFFLARSAITVIRSLIRDLPRLRPGFDPGVRDVLDTTSMYLLWGVYALVSLFLLGFSFTSLAVVAGGLSVGIGFGLQNIVNNFVAGLILLFGRSIQAGDTIQIDGTWGQVRKVNIRNTVVQTFDNATLFVPNSDLIAGKLINWTHRDPTVRREIAVGVAYGSNTEKVRTILLESARNHPRVLGNPEPSVQFLNFGESSLDFKLFFWVDNVSAGMSTTSDIRFAIDKRFREEGIEIPFPQREVRIVEGMENAVHAAAGASD